MKRISDFLAAAWAAEGSQPGEKPAEYVRVEMPSKPDRKHVVAQARRFESLPKPPFGTGAMQELVDRLAELCESNEHVTRAVDAILDAPPMDRCVTGYDVRRVVLETRTIEMRADPHCKECHGSGWLIREMPTPEHLRRNLAYGPTYTAGERCPCRAPRAVSA